MRTFYCLILAVLFSNLVISQEEETPREVAYFDGFLNLLLGEYEEAEINFTKAIQDEVSLDFNGVEWIVTDVPN